MTAEEFVTELQAAFYYDETVEGEKKIYWDIDTAIHTAIRLHTTIDWDAVLEALGVEL